MKTSNLFFVVLLLLPVCTWSGALAQTCIPSGTEVSINAALTSVGSVAILCPSAIFLLNNDVTFTANNQQIYTLGLPTGNTRAILRINGPNLAIAVNGVSRNGTVIKNIQIDGSRPALGRIDGGGANIEIGNAWNQVIDNVFSHDPRGWSCMHIIKGPPAPAPCHYATISNNQVGPSGTPDQWADGISLDCYDSVVTNNVITDATDGAIVIFGAPGSIIENNIVIAATQTLLGGINMVDYDQYLGSYLGTRVQNNTVNAQGAFIKTGIAMGTQPWGCPSHGTNYGAIVSGNTLMGAHFGYGYPVNGVRNWTVTGNVDNARHVGVSTISCQGVPIDLPAGFQFQPQGVTASSLQSEYVSASLNYTLGVTEPSILTVVQPSTACGIFSGNQGLLPGQTAKSCDGRFALTLQSGGNLVLMFGSTLLWQTSTSGRRSAQAFMQNDGNFVIYNSTGNAVWDTATAGNDGATFTVQNDGNMVLRAANGTALWNSLTCCHEGRSASM